jgi:hypothetical protein
MRIVHLDDQETYSILLQKIIKPEIYIYYNNIDECINGVIPGDIIILDFLFGDSHKMVMNSK